jgi:exopolyphosphatase/guanosine-5'-triphosphate,3'-diphosphate pyrophosphatase
MTDYNGSTPKSAYLELGSTSMKFYVIFGGGEDDLEFKVPWTLGYDVFEHGRISPRTISHCVETLKGFREEFPQLTFSDTPAVGTSALREAQNAELLQDLLAKELGLRIHIIAGGIEAFLLETGFRELVEVYPTALFDLGGGSNEIIEYLSPSSTRKTSVPIGAIRLHCQLRRTHDLFEYVSEGRRVVEQTLREHLIGEIPQYPEMVGTGGTVRAIMKCANSESFEIEDVRDLIRREIHGAVWGDMQAHRRKLLLPGLLAIEGMFTTLGVERIVYRSASVKRGLVSFTRMLPSLGAR